jgi:hypothetical protein
MTKQRPEEIRETLDEKRQQLDARLARWRARDAVRQRQREARKRALAAAVIEHALMAGGDQRAQALALLDRALCRPADRALFGLDDPEGGD